MCVIAETDVGQLEQPSPLDVHLLVGVHQNVGYRRVLQQRLQRPQSEHFVQDFVADLLFLERAEQRRLSINQLNHGLAHFAAHTLIVDCGQRLEVDLVHQLPVEREFQLLVFRFEVALLPGRVFEQSLFPGDLLCVLVAVIKCRKHTKSLPLRL